MSGIIEKTHRPIYGQGSKAPHVDKSAAVWAIQQGYKIRFEHATGHTVEFPGNVTSFSDSHKGEHEMRYFQDDQNPIFNTKWTARQISFTLSLANASLEEARYNEQNINLLLCMMYPQLDSSGAKTGTPEIYCHGLAFLQDPGSKAGIGLYIGNLTYSPNMDAGFITSKGTGIRGEDEIYPVQIDIQITGDAKVPVTTDSVVSPFSTDYPKYY